MTVAKTTGKITFEYLRADLFDSVSLETLTAASKIEKNGEIQIDEYGISADELDIFVKFLKEAHMNISRVLIKMTNGVISAMVLDDTDISYSVTDKEGYNENVLGVIDEMIYQALNNFICKEWFVKCALGDLAKYYNEKYLDNVKMIIRHSLSLRKPAMT